IICGERLLKGNERVSTLQQGITLIRIAATSASSNSEEDLERLVQEAGLAPS
ncbi:unnamed protein product, partial [Symbiodinium sp. CCMP2456]